jgi:hypothetical protein
VVSRYRVDDTHNLTLVDQTAQHGSANIRPISPPTLPMITRIP